MERERLREREREAKFTKDSVPEYHLKRDEERKHLFSLPRVIKPEFHGVGAEITKLGRDTAERNEETGSPLRWYVNKWQELRYPVYTMACHIKRGLPKPGRWGGGHRHFFEAVYYVSGGKGHEEQDGVTYEWDGEGLLCVPTYAIHRHFTDVPGPPELDEIRFCIKSRLYEYLGICDYEFYDMSRRALEAMGGVVPEWYGTRNAWLENVMYARKAVRWDGGTPRTIYDRYLKELVDQNEWYRKARRFIPCAEVPWEDTRQGKMKWMIHPETDCCIRTLDMYMQEIPPGSRSGKHRHVSDEVVYIIEGKGYDVHEDGQRWEWEAGDVVCIPVLTAHQHFNSDPKKPVRFISHTTRWYSMVGCGGIEQMEDAP